MILLKFESGACYRLPGIIKKNEKTFLFCLESEQTLLGKCFVDSIWFDHPVTLIDTETKECAEARIWRCHITGPVFAECLKKVREKDPANDFAAVWEIRAGFRTDISGEEVNSLLKCAKHPEEPEIRENHLDHIRLYGM